MLNSLDSIEGEVTQLLQQVNITIDDLSTHNKQIDFKTYSEKINEFNKLVTYQKVLVSLLEEISKLTYSLNRGAIKAEICYSMFNGYMNQSNDSLAKLKLWHDGSYDGITDKLFDIIHHKGAFYYGN